MYEVALRTSWHERLDPVLGTAGLVVDAAAAIGLVITSGRNAPRQVERVFEDWIVGSVPHLLIAAHPYGIEVGPWVLPGISPCAHCVAAATLAPPPGELPPLPAALWSLAAGWAARDLATWQRGDSPATWGTSWLLGVEPVPSSRRWLRHPYCGCAWFDL